MKEAEKLRSSQLDDEVVIEFRFPRDIVAHREFAERFYVKHLEGLTSRKIERNVTPVTTFTMDFASREA